MEKVGQEDHGAQQGPLWPLKQTCGYKPGTQGLMEGPGGDDESKAAFRFLLLFLGHTQ